MLVILVGLFWSISEFGSLSHAWLYASGFRLIVDRPTVRLPDGKPGDERDAEFLVYNFSAHPVRILGVTTSCGCLSTDKLPVTISPRGIKELRLTLHLEKSGIVEQTIIYHTDEPNSTNLAVTVSARVSDP